MRGIMLIKAFHHNFVLVIFYILTSRRSKVLQVQLLCVGTYVGTYSIGILY